MKIIITIMTLAFVATGCSINPGVVLTEHYDKNDLIELTNISVNSIVEPVNVIPKPQELIDTLVNAIYTLEVKISGSVYTSGTTDKSINKKYRAEFDSILLEILSKDNVPAEVWDSVLRIGIIFKHESLNMILTNMEMALEERTFTQSRKKYPIVKGYLGKLYPGWPSRNIADQLKTGFDIHSDNKDNLSRWLFHMIKDIKTDHPDFDFQFFGPERLTTFLYAAEYTIRLIDNGKSYYPEPIDLSLPEKEKILWLNSHLAKYNDLIHGGNL